MADKTIKTKIVLDGEKEFKAGLSEASRALKVTESEMKAAASAYGVTGDRASYLAERQRLLKQALSQQEGTVRALQGRVTEYNNALGASNAGTQTWTIRLNNAQTKANKYREELQRVEREMQDLGRESVQAGRKLEQGLGESAHSVSTDVSELADSLQGGLSAIQFGSVASGIKSVWDMASGAYSAIDGFVSGTVDYRRQLSFLEQQAQMYGFDFKNVKNEIATVQVLTGDVNSAMQTVSALMATSGVNDMTTLNQLWEGIAGAVIKYSDTMSSEGMAQAIQETLATGSAVGQLAEYLEKEGVDVDEFNRALQESDTAAGDLNIVLAYLAAGGLNDVYTQWREVNKGFEDARKAESGWAEELAKTAGYLEKWVVTPVKDALTVVLKELNDALGEIEEKGAKQYIEGKKQSVENALIEAGVPEETINKANELGSDYASGVEEFVGSKAGKAMLMTGQLMQLMVWGSQYGAIKALWNWGGDIITGAERKTPSYVNKEIEPADWTQEKQAKADDDGKRKKQAGQPTMTMAELLEEATRQLMLEEAARQAAEEDEWSFSDVSGLVMDENGVYVTPEEAKAAGEESGQAYAEGFEEGWDFIDPDVGELVEADGITDETEEEWKNDLEEAGEEAGEAALDGYETGTAGAGDMAYQTGQDMATQMAAGMLSKVSYIGYAGRQLANAANGGASTGAGSTGGTVINVGLNVDGREFAKATASYVGQELART